MLIWSGMAWTMTGLTASIAGMGKKRIGVVRMPLNRMHWVQTAAVSPNILSAGTKMITTSVLWLRIILIVDHQMPLLLHHLLT
jgi:hypothetical protein